MNVAALLFQANMPAHPGANTPTFTVYVPVGRFDGIVQLDENVRLTFAEKVWLSQYCWNTFCPEEL